MNVEEVRQSIAKENPNLFTGISPKKTKEIVRAVFACLRKTIDATPEGSIQIKGLGGFHVRQVERDVRGEKIKRKVVVFRTAKAQKRSVE